MFKLAIRNLLANSRRTFFTLSAILLSSTLLLIGLTWVDGVKGDFFSNTYLQYGHVRITHPDFVRKERTRPYDLTLVDLPELIAHLKKMRLVQGVSLRLNLGGLIDFNGENKSYPGLALDPGLKPEYLPYNGTLIAGHYLSSGKNEILIGRTIADDLHIRAGDVITMISKSRYDSISGLNFKVAGIFDLNSSLLNKRFFIDLASADYLLEMNGEITECAVFAKSFAESKKLKQQILGDPFFKNGKYSIMTWDEHPSVKPILSIVPLVMGIMVAMIIFIAALAVLNPMLVSVMERKREIGIMEALGFQKLDILKILVTEALVIGGVGSILGSLVGTPFALYLTRTGIIIKSAAVEGLPFAFSNVVHGSFSVRLIIFNLLIGIGAAVVGTLYPALKAVMIQPVEAIHEK